MTTVDAMGYRFRTARPEDTEAIETLDGSFTAHTMFRVAVTTDGFAVREVPVAPPIHKVFPPDDGDDESGPTAAENPNFRTVVAVDADGCLVGCIAVSYAPWNRRLTIADVAVAPAHRGRGVARALMGHAAAFAHERGAVHIWLEVTNINAPAVHAYQRMGFTFCGLDTALYEGTPSSGEQALYMSMPCL
ncbi:MULTISPECIES: GNAT family N-acetyltransferase [Streptomyces]|uniref:GNAT family N-acetyltransferase n=1 Tax=Streptomyces TaxID=1883 RepID=UPI001422070F|nr:GNAT family N-acetyltransferase [Streptomyces sp. MBT27]